MKLYLKNQAGNNPGHRASRYCHWFLCLFTALCLCQVTAQAQYSVIVTSLATPVYSPYLNDYLYDLNKVRINLINLDPRNAQRIKLTCSFIGDNGVSILTDLGYKPASPLILSPSATLSLNGNDLAPYFKNANVTLKGITKQALLANQPLPEGYYTLCVHAFDYYSGAALSDPNNGCTSFAIKYVEAPFIQNPRCGDSIVPIKPQTILFQWSTPATVGTQLQYKLKIVEMLPSYRNPGDALNSATTPAFFETTTSIPMYNYGISDPPLREGYNYAFRVTVSDLNNKAYFLNYGNSEVCYFTVKNGVVIATDTSTKMTVKLASKKMDGTSTFHISGNINYYYKDPNNTSTALTGQEPKGYDAPNPMANTSVSLVTACALVPRYHVQRLIHYTLKNGKDTSSMVTMDSIAAYSLGGGVQTDAATASYFPQMGTLGKTVGDAVTDANGYYSFDIKKTNDTAMIIESFPPLLKSWVDTLKTLSKALNQPWPNGGYVMIKGYIIRVNNPIYCNPAGILYAKAGGSAQASDMRVGIKSFGLSVTLSNNAVPDKIKNNNMTVYILKKTLNSTFPATEGDGAVKETLNISGQQGVTQGKIIGGTYVHQYYLPKNDGVYYVVSKKVVTPTSAAVFYKLISYVAPGDEYYVYATIDQTSILFEPAMFKSDLVKNKPQQTGLFDSYTNSFIIKPKFVDLTISGKMLYSWDGNPGTQKVMPPNTRLKLVSMYVVPDPLNNKKASFQDIQEIASASTDNSGSFNFQVGKLNYDTFINKTGQGSYYNHLYVLVDNPYYFSPPDPITVSTGVSKDCGNLVAYVKECTISDRIVKKNADGTLSAVTTGINVYLCRRADDNFVGLPQDEGALDKSNLYKKQIKDNAGVTYNIIEENINITGQFHFNRVVLADFNNPLDRYYIMAESPAASPENYFTDQAAFRSFAGDEEFYKKKLNWQKEVLAFDACAPNNPGYAQCGIEVQPQPPYVAGAVYPVSNTSTSVITGAKVELFDMGSEPSTLNTNYVASILQYITPQATALSDDFGKFRFDNLTDPANTNVSWKVLRVSKAGFLDTVMILNGGGPMVKGSKADIGKIYLALPVQANVYITSSDNTPVPSKIIVGDKDGNTFSWSDAIAFGSQYAVANVSCPASTTPPVRFIIIPNDQDNYYTDTFYQSVTRTTTDLKPFTVKVREHHISIKCYDLKTNNPIKATAYITNLTTDIESKEIIHISAATGQEHICQFDFKNPGTSFNIKIIPDGDYVIKEINVADDASVKPSKDGTGHIVKVYFDAATSISGTVYLKSGTHNEPINDANVYIEELPLLITTGARSAGMYTIRHVPIGQNITLDAATTQGNYVGDQQKMLTTAAPITKDLYITEFTAFDITHLMGFQMSVTKLVPTTEGVFVSGRVQVSGNDNPIFKSKTTKPVYVNIKNVKLEEDKRNGRTGYDYKSGTTKHLPACKPVMLPVTTDDNTLECLAYGTYVADIANYTGLTLSEYKTGYGALDGYVQIDPASFGSGFTPDGAICLNLYNNSSIKNAPAKASGAVVNASSGKFKYNSYIGNTVSTDQLHTFTADGQLPDGYGQGFKVSDINLQTITYLLHNIYHHVSTSTISTFNSSGLQLLSMIHTNLEHVDSSDIKFLAMVNVDHDNGAKTVSGSGNVAVNIGNWSIVSDQWQLDHNGLVFTKGHINASGIAVPFSNMAISEKQIGFATFNFTTLTILNSFPVNINNSNTITSFGYDKGYGTGSGAWSLSLLSTGAGPLATITGLPDMASTDNILISNINLYSNDDSRIILQANHPQVTLNGISKYTPSTVFGTKGYLVFTGIIDLEIPSVTGLGSVPYYLKYVTNNGKLVHKHDIMFKGLAMRVNGINIVFDTTNQVFTENTFRTYGVLTDVANPNAYKFKVALFKTLTGSGITTQIFIDEVNYPNQRFNIGQNGKAYLSNVQGSMTLSSNGTWPKFSFSGDITGLDGIDPKNKNITFTVNGDLTATGATIGIGNIGPVQNIKLTVDFDHFLIVGTANIDMDISVGHVSMDIELQLGDGQYYAFGAGNIIINDFPIHQFGVVLMVGKATISDEQYNIMLTHFHDNTPPDNFTTYYAAGKTLTGVLFIGGFDVPIPIIPEFDLNLGPIAHCTLEHGIFADEYFKLDFQTPAVNIGGTVGVWVHLGVGASIGIACACVDLKATVSNALGGNISASGVCSASFDIQLIFTGSAYVGAGVCNSDCETPSVFGISSPIPCVKVGLSKTLIITYGATLDNNGIHPKPLIQVQ